MVFEKIREKLESKFSQSHEKICNPLPGYRFSIDDFQYEQVEKLRNLGMYFGGNSAFQDLLYNEIKSQLFEREKFFGIVKRNRLDVLVMRRFQELFEKMHAPKYLQTLCSNYLIKDFSFPLQSWQPHDSLQNLIFKKCPEEVSLASMHPTAIQLSGFERLKQAFFPSFFISNYSSFEPSHVHNRNYFVNTTLGAGLIVGMIMGVSYGLKYRSEFDRTRGSNMYSSRLDAVRSRQNSFLNGYGRYLFRWGWRYSYLIGSVFLISQGLAIYRLKESMLHYMIGTFLPFAFYKWQRGPRGMLVYGTIGSIVVGLPLSFLCCVLKMNPRTMLFDASVYPKVSNPQHWTSWTDEDVKLNETRYRKIREELSKPHGEDKDTGNVYKGLFST